MSAMPSAQKPEGKPPRVTRCARLPGRQVSMIPDRNAPGSLVTNVHLPDVDEAFATKDAYAGRLHGRLAQRGGERHIDLGFEPDLRDQRLDDSEIEAAVLFASSGCRRLDH